MHQMNWPAAQLAESYISAAAEELYQRRRQGLMAQRLADALRPHTVLDAFAIQQQVAKMMGKVIGWKCGMPKVSDDGVWQPVLAPLYASELQQGDVCRIWPSAEQQARIEPEYAYPVLTDLIPSRQYHDGELFAAVGLPHIAFELIQSRFQPDANASYYEQLADGLFNQGLWLGPRLQHQEQSRFLLKSRQAGLVLLTQASYPYQQPMAPIVPVLRFLLQQGITVAQGQLLITGSFAGVMSFPMASPIRFFYGAEPEFSLQFLARGQDVIGHA
jgi:2-keto-4-pentenoate hydratase